MGRYEIEGIAKGVDRSSLWTWYTDFRGDEDIDILKREGVKAANGMRTREARHEGNKVWLEQTFEIRGRPLRMSMVGTMHPDRFEYDIESNVTGMVQMRETRHYAFTQTPEGTKIRADCALEQVQGGAKFLDALGVLSRSMRKGSKEVMDGFLRAAEKDLSGSVR